MKFPMQLDVRIYPMLEAYLVYILKFEVLLNE